jgi:hypothetical protein
MPLKLSRSRISGYSGFASLVLPGYKTMILPFSAPSTSMPPSWRSVSSFMWVRMSLRHSSSGRWFISVALPPHLRLATARLRPSSSPPPCRSFTSGHISRQRSYVDRPRPIGGGDNLRNILDAPTTEASVRLLLALPLTFAVGALDLWAAISIGLVLGLSPVLSGVAAAAGAC